MRHYEHDDRAQPSRSLHDSAFPSQLLRSLENHGDAQFALGQKKSVADPDAVLEKSFSMVGSHHDESLLIVSGATKMLEETS